MAIGKEIPWVPPRLTPKKCAVCERTWHTGAVRTCPVTGEAICLYCCQKKKCRHLEKTEFAAVYGCDMLGRKSA
jgi:hypothetical protein